MIVAVTYKKQTLVSISPELDTIPIIDDAGNWSAIHYFARKSGSFQAARKSGSFQAIGRRGSGKLHAAMLMLLLLVRSCTATLIRDLERRQTGSAVHDTCVVPTTLEDTENT
jgi:hypothetical protein